MYQQYGFQSPRSGSAKTVEEAAQVASSIGFPVALKVISHDILHKTDVGGVALALQTVDEVRRAFGRITASARAAKPQARIDGVQIQEMVTGGAEIIIGLLDDPQFGPAIMFGLGGVFTEILRDISFRPLPISRSDAVQMIHETQGYRILQGYRGAAPVSEEMLAGLLLNASRMGMDLAGKLESLDFNPIVVWQDQHRVLDAKFVMYPQVRPLLPTPPPNPKYLNSFFKAESVALVGASATPGKIGHSVLDSLVNYEYRGRVYPVNPTRDEIMGIKTCPSLADVPERVDVVVATVDLRMVPDVIRACGARGIHNLVVVSGGGKELGGEKVDLEAEIRRLARDLEVRVIGPNCIGVFDGHSRFDTFFQVHERMLRPTPGKVAMLTQSGTIGVNFLEDAADLGASKFVSYGNRTDVDEADLLTFLAADPETELIAMYVEGFEDGRKFLEAAKQVARVKPIVIFKVGRTERAARASVSHTGFFGGSYAVVRGAFAQAGVIAVDSYEELFAAAKALAMQPRARGPRVAMIGNGAGCMVQGIDLLRSYGLELPELTAESISKLTAVYPPFYIVQNPIDVTGSASSTDYENGIEALLRDPNIDIVMPWFVFQDTPLGEDISLKLGRLSKSFDKPILVGAMGGPYTIRMSKEIEAEGVPVFHSVRDWIAAAHALAPRS